jgi:predicted nucleic acid-binding protein
VILFCDTSALVKLYVAEAYSEEVLDLYKKASLVVVSRVTYAEAMAGLSRRSRESPVDRIKIEALKETLKKDWPAFGIVELTQSIVELAATYADLFALRGFDSIQLASAKALQMKATDPVHFSCFDQRLAQASAVLGMQISTQ